MSASAAFAALDANGDGVISREEFVGAVQMQGAAGVAATMPSVTYAGGYVQGQQVQYAGQVVGQAGAVTYAAPAATTYVTGAAPQTISYGAAGAGQVTYAAGGVAAGQVTYAGPATTTTAAPVYVESAPTVTYATGVAGSSLSAEQAGVVYAAPQEAGVVYTQAPTVSMVEGAGAVQYVQAGEVGGAMTYQEAAPTVTYVSAPGAATYTGGATYSVVESSTAPVSSQGAVVSAAPQTVSYGSVSAAPARAASMTAAPAGVTYGSVAAAPAITYAAGAPTVTYQQPATVYQAATHSGAVYQTGGEAALAQQVVTQSYGAQQIPSFVAAPGSLTYGLPATQAGIPPQSISYGQPGVALAGGAAAMGMTAGALAMPGSVSMTAPGAVSMTADGAAPNASLATGQSMVAYTGSVGTVPGVMDGMPGAASMQGMQQGMQGMQQSVQQGAQGLQQGAQQGMQQGLAAVGGGMSAAGGAIESTSSAAVGAVGATGAAAAGAAGAAGAAATSGIASGKVSSKKKDKSSKDKTSKDKTSKKKTSKKKASKGCC